MTSDRADNCKKKKNIDTFQNPQKIYKSSNSLQKLRSLQEN
jgi:hypothetical protein